MDLERFWKNIDKATNGCWIWKTKQKRRYYYYRCNDKMVLIHRISYESSKGKIPSNYEIDHLCKNTLCINPDHLEAVTHKENMMRSNAPCASYAKRDSCHLGHPFTPENTYMTKNKGRSCRRCRKISDARQYIKIKKIKDTNRQKKRESLIGVSHEQFQLRKQYFEKWISKGLRTHCKFGHKITMANMTISIRGQRLCLDCKREYDKKYMRVKRLKKEPKPFAIS